MPTNSRNWCFTLNNPSSDILLASWTQVKFLCAVLETGASGTPHFQGYMELKTSRTLSQVKAIFLGDPHLEMRISTKKAALSYVLKTMKEGYRTSTEFVTSCTSEGFRSISPIPGWNQLEYPPVIIFGFEGTWKELFDSCAERISVAKRLEQVRLQLQEGAGQLEIADNDFELWVKYNKAFQHYALLQSKPRDFKTKVIVVQGPTGTGKSRYALDFDPSGYWKPRNQWWDGYNGQNTVVLDEFYGWLQFDQLLRLCDRYPLNVEIKGGTVNFSSETIIITTNKHPRDWYNNVYFDAFVRRVDKWITMGREGNVNEEEDYNRVNFLEL